MHHYLSFRKLAQSFCFKANVHACIFFLFSFPLKLLITDLLNLLNSV